MENRWLAVSAKGLEELPGVLVTVALVLNYLAALATAAHAAMYKRDPKAAAGFILAVFALPFLGPLFYWLFGVNRIRRRRLHDLPGAGPPAEPAEREALEVESELARLEAEDLRDLVHTGRRVTGRPLRAGNTVEALVAGEEAYPAMLEALAGARETAWLSTYIFEADATGHRFAEALIAAHQRGVEVRVIIDALGEKYSWRRIRKVLRRAGVPCVRFKPPIPLWRGAFVNLRNHRKILVVDRELGFTGGMNIRDGHLLNDETRPHRVRDMHFRLRGPAVGELEEVFIEDWWFLTGEKLADGGSSKPTRNGGSALCRGICDGPDQDLDRLRYLFLGAVACARERVQIMTPYFIPDRALLTGLVTTALRGVPVELVLPQRSNIPFFDWAMTSYFWELLRYGVKIYLDPPPFNHTKLMLVDGVWVLIGSANLDPRSLRLNFEFNVEVYDRDLGLKAAREFQAAAARAHPVTLEEVDARSIPVRLRDGIAKLFSPYL